MAIVTEDFEAQADFVAASEGMPDVPRVVVPHPIAGAPDDAVRHAAAAAAPEILRRLTDSEAAVGTVAARREVSTRTAADDATALDELHAAGRTDGLPVVVPTRDRVDALLAAVPFDPADDLGRVGPSHRRATVEAVAVNAVMAGCLPGHFPVVVAAVRAVLDPAFDLTEVQSTTHNVAPLIVVHGPVRDLAAVSSGTGALGPGHRANACIGRALRLVLMNVGGARPGISDMALLGHPGKFTYCLAEAEEESPFEPMHVARGLDASTSAVTVVGCEAPHSVISVPRPDLGPAGLADAILRVLSAGLGTVCANNVYAGRGNPVVVLNPGHARLLAAGGHDRASIQAALHAHARAAKDLLVELAGVAPGDGSICEAPEDILVLVAGGDGLYSAVMPTWGAGEHGNRAITEEVVWTPGTYGD